MQEQHGRTCRVVGQRTSFALWLSGPTCESNTQISVAAPTQKRVPSLASCTNFMTERHKRLTVEISNLLNKYSAENGSDTPDFILAEYLMGCLAAYDKAVQTREKWYGRIAVPVDVPPGAPSDVIPK